VSLQKPIKEYLLVVSYAQPVSLAEHTSGEALSLIFKVYCSFQEVQRRF